MRRWRGLPMVAAASAFHRGFHGDQARRRDRRGPDGQRHRPRLRARRLRRAAPRRRPRGGSTQAPRDHRAATSTARSPAARSPRPSATRRWRASRSSPSSRRSAQTDLVIEAATENEALKQQIFKALRAAPARRTRILASNTSSISITRLASATDRPERFIGLHFMNPVPVMKLVEIIRGIATDEPTYDAAGGFVAVARQDHRQRRGLPGLHRQPHPGADDQRGDLHALRGRRHGRRDRHGA